MPALFAEPQLGARRMQSAHSNDRDGLWPDSVDNDQGLQAIFSEY